MDNILIAQKLASIATYLELKGENPFKVRAYQLGAHTIETLAEDLGTLIAEERLSKIPGIGPALAEKITTLYQTGELAYYDELKASLPSGLLECLEVPGLGPKKVRALYDSLAIQDLATLKQACEGGTVAALKGFGEKTAANILSGIRNREAYARRHLHLNVTPIVESFSTLLKQLPGVLNLSPAGSYRRGLETVGDIDFIIGSEIPEPIMQAFITHPEVESVTAQGSTKSSVRLQNGLQVDLRIVPPPQYPFALHHFTGSKDHNIQLRSRALSQGLSLSEWGLRPAHSGDDSPYETTNIQTEADLFKHLGLCFIQPELREGIGEIALAAQGPLPRLIEIADIRGAFHNHTTASDGRHSLEAMAAAADALGWEYLGIADHSKSSIQANGLSEERLLAQIETIQALNTSKRFNVHLFTGTECDILPDGQLDFPDTILSQLDYVVASVHSAFTQDEATMTARIIRALENPYVTMLGHPTGRLLLKREAYALNLPKIIDAALANKKIIELNAQPSRLDMDWRFWRQSADRDLMCSINPDAHATTELNYTLAAIPIAQKGFLTKERVLNTKNLEEIKTYFKR